MMPLIPPGTLDEHVKVVAVTALATAAVVLLHYEGLRWLARHYGPRTHHSRERHRHRRGFIGLIFALLLLHVLEIWCYGIAYYWLEHQPDMGFVHGEHGIRTLFDAIYFSATIYTTLGLGDLSPVGAIRLVSGMEAVTGLLLITWSASFTYLEMHQHWTRPDQHD